MVLRSKRPERPSISVRDLVDVFVKQGHQKRGKFIRPKNFLTVNVLPQLNTYPVLKRNAGVTALEDLQGAIEKVPLAKQLHNYNHRLDCLIEEQIDDLKSPQTETEEQF